LGGAAGVFLMDTVLDPAIIGMFLAGRIIF